MEGPRMARVEVTEGEFAGWTRFEDEVFQSLIGPFYARKADGQAVCAFRAERRHMNIGGRMHGGCLMAFADFALFMIARDGLEGGTVVTVTLDNQLLAGVREGELGEGHGEVTRTGASLIFARGELTSGGKAVLTFSGVIKRTG